MNFYVPLLFILVLCHFNIISGWLQYCIYHKIHVTRNISVNFRIYSTTFKTSNDFNAISTYVFIVYALYKYWSTLPEDVPSSVETCRSSSALIVKTLYCNIVHLLVFYWNLTTGRRIRMPPPPKKKKAYVSFFFLFLAALSLHKSPPFDCNDIRLLVRTSTRLCVRKYHRGSTGRILLKFYIGYF